MCVTVIPVVQCNFQLFLQAEEFDAKISIDDVTTPLNALKLAELPEDQAVLDSADEDDDFEEKDEKEKVWRRRERPLLKVKSNFNIVC